MIHAVRDIIGLYIVDSVAYTADDKHREHYIDALTNSPINKLDEWKQLR